MNVEELIRFLQTCDKNAVVETCWAADWNAASQEPIVEKNIVVEGKRVIIQCD